MSIEQVRTSPRLEEISVVGIILALVEWYRFLLGKWLVILVFGVFGSIVGIVYSMLSKPVYIASTTFVLENGDGAGGGLGQYAGLASMVGIDLGNSGGGIFQGDNILELYKSRLMIEKTLLSEINLDGKNQLLIDYYLDFNGIRSTWLKDPVKKNIKFIHGQIKSSRLQDSVLGAVTYEINKKFLKVSKPDKKLSIIKVDVSARDEIFAKVFNDEIVKNVNDFYIQTKTKKSLDNVVILNNKVDSVRRVMTGAIYSSATIADATPNLNPTRQAQRTAPMQRNQFTAETNKAILEEMVKNLEMSKIVLLKETPLIQVVDQPKYPLNRERVGKTKGMIIGGILFGLSVVIYLTLRRMFANILNS